MIISNPAFDLKLLALLDGGVKPEVSKELLRFAECGKIADFSHEGSGGEQACASDGINEMNLLDENLVRVVVYEFANRHEHSVDFGIVLSDEGNMLPHEFKIAWHGVTEYQSVFGGLNDFVILFFGVSLA